MFEGKFWKFARSIPPVLSVGLCFVILVGAGTIYWSKKYPVKTSADTRVREEEPKTDKPSVVADGSAKETVSKNPPKHSNSGISKKTVTTAGGKATIVSEGTISEADLDTLQKYSTSGPVSNIYYNDMTGSYPGLEGIIKDYLKNGLYYSSDISYMYELRIVDCASCSWGGLYTGSYITDSGGDITKAFGWITLNVYYYKSSPYFNDYMKLIFSHEYGHHYSLYHRWVDLDIPTGDRWPATYYSIRPLSLATTATDYSKGWSNCDVEIVAEDYSYLFSGYGYHAMSGTYGYPSNPGTKNWLYSMAGSGPPTDSTPPNVSISSPANGATVSGIVNVVSSASDNVGVVRVEIYLDDVKIATINTAPYEYAWETRSYANGSHSLKAKAFDANQSAESGVTVTINNTESDSEKPVVSVSDPASSPVSWSAGNLHILASATDNVAVTKIEIYINGTLVASEDASSIERYWVREGTPDGSYTMTFKAYDPSGNIGVREIIVNKT